MSLCVQYIKGDKPSQKENTGDEGEFCIHRFQSKSHYTKFMEYF